MKRKKILDELMNEARIVIDGILDAGHKEQFRRISWSINSDFFMKFPKEKQFFILFVEDDLLQYCAFDSIDSAQCAAASLLGNLSQYRILPRSIALMVGWEYEFWQYCEIVIANTDEEAEAYHQKQKEILSFLFSAI